MSIIATCGHELTLEEGDGVMIATRDFDKKGNETTSYPVLCNNCFEWYKKNGLVIKIMH